MFNYQFIWWRHNIQSKSEESNPTNLLLHQISNHNNTKHNNQTKISSSTNTNALTNCIPTPNRKKWQPIHNTELNLRWWNTEKITSYFRLIYQNIDGLELSNDAFTLEEIRDSIFRQAADVVCLSETNTHWKYPSSKYKTTKILKQFWSKLKLITFETSTPWEIIHKPGGTVTIATIDTIPHITNSREDKELMGRWSYITIGGGGESPSHNNKCI